MWRIKRLCDYASYKFTTDTDIPFWISFQHILFNPTHPFISYIQQDNICLHIKGSPFIGGLISQVGWLGQRVGDHPALSLHSSNELGELPQWPWSWGQYHKHCHWIITIIIIIFVFIIIIINSLSRLQTGLVPNHPYRVTCTPMFQRVLSSSSCS